jgi:hypothetical protein
MGTKNKSRNKTEFGDFQTPLELARQVCLLLSRSGLEPVSIIEPTCGTGNFIIAALEQFTSIRNIVGIDINGRYTEIACASIDKLSPNYISKIFITEDFFKVNWSSIIEALPEPLLIIGNPPWVTNSQLGRIEGSNLPSKANFQNYRGIDAITGKSNFDISEWMLNKTVELITDRDATLAMLCKKSVARKVLYHHWKSNPNSIQSEIYNVETSVYFDASVDACLLVVSPLLSERNLDCRVFDSLKDTAPAFTFGYRQGTLAANIDQFERLKHLQGKEYYKWRSGVKHDCSKVMEFRRKINGYQNGFGELVELEDEFMYPMLKSSEIANVCNRQPTRWMLVTQHIVGEDTKQIRYLAPKTWQYLQKHAHLLDGRASSVYRDKPRFSMFGIGEYTFAPWKVAISGFYKEINFRVVGPHLDKPVVLDDTCYFILCLTEQEAFYIADILNSDVAKEFYSAFIFWDDKRPITADILKRLDLLALAGELGMEETFKGFLQQYPQKMEQTLLFSK